MDFHGLLLGFIRGFILEEEGGLWPRTHSEECGTDEDRISALLLILLS
jgi:hypothetical protein